MRTGGMRVGNRCYIQAGTQISPSSRVARRLCCEDPGTCLYREACSRYTEPVPVAARGGELGAPGSCADHRTCSHVRNCRYEDEGVSMGRARERAVCACDVVWVLKGSDPARHPHVAESKARARRASRRGGHASTTPVPLPRRSSGKLFDQNVLLNFSFFFSFFGGFSPRLNLVKNCRKDKSGTATCLELSRAAWRS